MGKSEKARVAVLSVEFRVQHPLGYPRMPMIAQTVHDRVSVLVPCSCAPSARQEPSKSRGSYLRTYATTMERNQAALQKSEKTWERVLRYPGGQERRIRYPTPAIVEDEEPVPITDSFERLSDWWGTDIYYYEASSDEEDESVRLMSQASAVHEGSAAPSSQRTQGLPSTPDELLRYINSDEFKAAGSEQLQLVRNSFQVLEGSPWLQTKPVFVLAALQPNSEAGMTFTLRTRVQQQGVEDQLSRVLGRRRADGNALIKCEELRDGIVMFEDEADAQRFASLLEADGTEAVVAECDAHELFRESRSARAVVVLIRACQGLSCHLPMPEELAAALRGQRSLEDPADL